MSDKDDKQETVEINPDKVYITQSGQNGRNGGFFDTVFGGFFDVFSDNEEDDFPVDVFDRDFVEINEVEIIDAQGNVHRSKGGKINDSNIDKQTQKPNAFEKLKNRFKK